MTDNFDSLVIESNKIKLDKITVRRTFVGANYLEANFEEERDLKLELELKYFPATVESYVAVSKRYIYANFF